MRLFRMVDQAQPDPPRDLVVDFAWIDAAIWEQVPFELQNVGLIEASPTDDQIAERLLWKYGEEWRSDIERRKSNTQPHTK